VKTNLINQHVRMAAAQILGPFGANPALLALPYMGGTAWIKQVAGLQLSVTAMQVFSMQQMNTAALETAFEKHYELNVRAIPDGQWPNEKTEPEIQKLLAVYQKTTSSQWINLLVKAKDMVKEFRNVVGPYVETLLPGGQIPSGQQLPDVIAKINQHMYEISENARVVDQESRAKKASEKASAKATASATTEAGVAVERGGRRRQPVSKQPMPSDYMYVWLAAFCLVVRFFLCGLRCLATRC
jgi:hypothetical protein